MLGQVGGVLALKGCLGMEELDHMGSASVDRSSCLKNEVMRWDPVISV